MKIRHKKFKKFLICIILVQISIIFSFSTVKTPENVSALEKDEVIKVEEKAKKQNESKVKKIQNVFIYTQSPQLFEKDNLNFRGDEKSISFKGDYLNYDYYSDDSIYYPIIFVGEKLREDFNINSGDKINFYSTDFIVIDNQSNCNNYTDDYCVEILSEKEFLDIQNIVLKEEK